MIKRTPRLVLLSVFVFASLISFIAPASASAAAPQDTYTWQKNIGTPGCNLTLLPGDMAVSGGKIYAYDGTAGAVDVFDSSGTFVKQVGSGLSGGITSDSSGDIYATTYNNGINKYDPAGNLVLSFGSYGSGNGQFKTPTDVAVDNSGNIYVADSYNFRIQKFDSNGNYLSQFGSQGWGSGKFQYLKNLAYDPAGYLYVTDSTVNIQKLDLSGNFVSQFGSIGTGNGQFKSGIGGISVDSTGDLLISDSGNNRIEKFSATGTYLSQFGTGGSGDGQLSNPIGLASDTSGNIIVADKSNKRIQKFTAAGTYVWQATYSPNSPTTLCRPYYTALGPDGNLYVTDVTWNNIKVYDPSTGAPIRTIGSYGTGDGQLRGPWGIAVDSVGDIYVVDSGNSRIEKFDRNGNYLSQFGSSGSGDGQFSDPEGIALDAAGNIYVADSNNFRIQKFSPSGTYLSQFGSAGACDGTATGSQFCYPDSIALDSSGDIYVGDEDSYVKKFDNDGTYLSKFGGDGAGDGQFGGWVPAITIDSNGSIYVDDNGNNRIQKFSLDGIYLSQFGTTGTGDGQFSSAYGMATDSDGNIYIADYNNRRISVWNAPILPSSPQNVTATPVSATSLKVTWAAPAHVGSSPLMGYRILYRVHGISSWTTAAQTDASTYTYTITKLTPNTQYDVQVVAFNTLGMSHSSSSASIVKATTRKSTHNATEGGLANTGTNVLLIAAIATILVGIGVTMLVRLRKGNRML